MPNALQTVGILFALFELSANVCKPNSKGVTMKYQLFEIIPDNDIELCGECAAYAYSKVQLEGLGTGQLRFTERKEKP